MGALVHIVVQISAALGGDGFYLPGVSRGVSGENWDHNHEHWAGSFTIAPESKIIILFSKFVGPDY